ncbi:MULTISPECIES: hypothetical protein [unclassified Clostridium]|uniref:hypothetical protein n=1 Tax=unclassified Clostridium TaxID=2614128 RepID=UPI0025C4233C|nr:MULTISPECIES: hypothetical protein [unclassified Clostridium]
MENNRIKVPDSSVVNIEYEYEEAVKQFMNNSIELDGEKYIDLNTAIKLLKNVSTFSSLFN